MINVRYYRTKTERKQDKVFGEFFTQTEPREIRPVNAELVGKALEKDQRRFNEETERALFDAKCAALDEVREIVGEGGVLVAYEVNEKEE